MFDTAKINEIPIKRNPKHIQPGNLTYASANMRPNDTISTDMKDIDTDIRTENEVSPSITDKIEHNTKQREFTDEQIQRLYEKHIAPKQHNQAYLEKYQWISNATWLAPEFDPLYFMGHNKAKFKFDLSRVIQTASFSEYVSKYSLTEPANCANTLTFEVGVDPEVQYFNGYFSQTLGIAKCVNFTSLYYADGHGKRDRKKSDLYTLDLDFKQWDIILLPQFLEHFYAPSIVMDNVFEHLKEGGYLYASAPTINLPHMTPIHFQHFEPMGLLMLAAQAGFEIKELDFWGNRAYIETLFRNQWWGHYQSHEYVEAEPLVNEPHCVSQVWGLFQKPITNSSVKGMEY